VKVGYSVTPNAERAGKEEVILRPYKEIDRDGVVFYVTPEEFETFTQEYPLIKQRQAQEADCHYQSFRIRNLLKEFAIARFILERFVTSPHLYVIDADHFQELRSA
jgi:hypothetical protein